MIIDVLLIGLGLYVVSTFAIIIYTAMTRPMDFITFLATLREVGILAVETMWWLLLLMAWGIIPPPQTIALSTRLPGVETPEGALVQAAVLFFALLCGIIYLEGHVWAAFGAAITSLVLLLPFVPVELLLLLGGIGVLGSFVAFLLWLQQRKELKIAKRRRRRSERLTLVEVAGS